MEYDYTPDVAQPMILAAMGAYWLVMLIAYLYMSFCLMTIANKTNTPNGWMAWIPILNIYLMCTIAGKPGWWVVLIFIPLVNIVIAIIIWMGIAKARNKPEWLGILMLVPFVNLVIPGYLAFSN